MEDQGHIDQNTQEQATIFAVLADPTRLKLVKLLQRQRGSSALCVNALASYLGVTQSAVSQHLRLLKSIGLVKGERRGYHIHYFINRNVLERYRELTADVLHVAAADEQAKPENEREQRRVKEHKE